MAHGKLKRLYGFGPTVPRMFCLRFLRSTHLTLKLLFLLQSPTQVPLLLCSLPLPLALGSHNPLLILTHLF